jgi:hypothetical protein
MTTHDSSAPKPGDRRLGADADPRDESKQTVANDAVAGEPVEGGVKDHRGPGKIEPIGGISDDEENRADFTAVDGEADTVADQAEASPDGGIARPAG